MRYLLRIGLFIISITIIYIVMAGAQQSDFKILDDKEQVGPIYNFHSEFLGMGLRYPSAEAVGYWLRMPEIKTPGDYFRHPAGAKEVIMQDSEIQEIKTALSGTIQNRLFDPYVLQNLRGYEYELFGGDIKRREYYVKYGRGDTLYVISGLLGEFLSFYRAVPTEKRLPVNELKGCVSHISPIVKFDNDGGFQEKENKFIYFNEYIDRSNKIRVRNYQIFEDTEAFFYSGDSSKLKGCYNLIEITRFLNEEAMP